MKNFKLFIKKNKVNKDKFNKNLLNFLINNVNELVHAGVFIRIILVNEKNIQAIHNLNIRSTPALYCSEEEPITKIGVNNIIQFLIDFCENGSQSTKNESNAKKEKELYVPESTDIKDMLTEIINADDDDSEDELNNDEIRRKMNERLNGASNENFVHKKSSNDFSRLKKDNDIQIDSIDMNVNTGDSAGDDAMAKYWANLEETDL